MKTDDVPEIVLLETVTLGPFAWRWPEDTEPFDWGWASLARVDGRDVHVRHGIGRRDAYGRSRLHSVTWVEGQPTVEGVEADDFAASESLLSLIKITKRHLRPGDSIPPGYGEFMIAVMADEVHGPYSPRSLAVKIRQDDVEGWTRHALLRAAFWGRLPARARHRASLPPDGTAGPISAAGRGVAVGESRRAVADALLAYGARQQPAPQGAAVQFTSVEAANELVRTNPFAFLVAVLLDQGIPAERAWLGPYLLRARLGHLEPSRIIEDEDAVRAAFMKPPKLHRYVEKMPHWLVLAARHIVEQYGGDAAAIRSDRPDAGTLQARLAAFMGIGQKKAAMAVEILERDLGVPVTNLQHSDLAVDVHVRRVFLRTRLAHRDDSEHMIAAARELHPSRPGALDLPVWLVGRNWCHPGLPNCTACPLTAVCPKDIERAAEVTSA